MYSGAASPRSTNSSSPMRTWTRCLTGSVPWAADMGVPPCRWSRLDFVSLQGNSSPTAPGRPALKAAALASAAQADAQFLGEGCFDAVHHRVGFPVGEGAVRRPQRQGVGQTPVARGHLRPLIDVKQHQLLEERARRPADAL